MKLLYVLPVALLLALGACGKKGQLEAPPGADPAKSDIDMQKDRKN